MDFVVYIWLSPIKLFKANFGPKSRSDVHGPVLLTRGPMLISHFYTVRRLSLTIGWCLVILSLLKGDYLIFMRNFSSKYGQTTIILKSIVQIRWTIVVTRICSTMVCHVRFGTRGSNFHIWTSNIEFDLQIYN